MTAIFAAILSRLVPLCPCRSFFFPLATHAHFSLPLSLSLCFHLRISFSFFHSFLSALHVDFSLDSRQHALLFFIQRRNLGYSLYPCFFCTLRYGASINNGPAYSSVAAVSTRVVLFVRSLLLCCSHHQRKTSFDPGTMVSYVPGVYSLVNIKREYSRASLETLAITGHYYPYNHKFFFFHRCHAFRVDVSILQ